MPSSTRRTLRVALLAAPAVLVTLGACAVGGTPKPAPGADAPATTAASTPRAAPATPATPPDALAFFRAQGGPCEEHAQQLGNPPVEPDRFSGAKVVRELGNGATLIVDGRGTQLVVVPSRGVVLPPSGRESDVMPMPYEFACTEKVFVGASHD
jgi:hypothetical protein